MAEYRETEKRVLAAVDAYQRGAFDSLKESARHFNVSYNRVKYRNAGGKSRSTRTPTNRLLTEEEEAGLVTWMKEREDLGCRVGLAEISRESIRVRTRRVNQPFLSRPLLPSQHWSTRFCERNGVETVVEKPKEAARQIAEDPVVIKKWFAEVEGIVSDLGLYDNDIWNFDEMGCMIGQGKRRKVTRFNKDLTATAGTNSNRLQVTIGETISASGNFIPPIVIIPGEEHQQRWYTQSNVPGNYQIGCTSSGYTNDEIHLQYIHHFIRWSARSQTSRYRILFLDGAKTHLTEDFLGECSDNLVLPIVFPAHLTHLMQPLDVKVFQPWKSHYKAAVNQAYICGADAIDVVDFLNILHQVRMQALKPSTIKHGFKETGLYPLDNEVILRQVRPETPPPAAPGTQSSPVPIEVTPDGPYQLRRYIDKHAWETEDAVDKIIRSAGALTTAFECLQQDLRAHNAQKQRQAEARKNARRSLKHCGLMTADQGRKMVHTLRDKAIKKAANRSEAAKKAAITRAKNAAAKQQAASPKSARFIVYNPPTTP